MEKNVYISMLLEVYETMLTDKQKDTVDLYYNNNLSLGEIADELKITRQGVRKNLVDAENKLYDLENKLNLLKDKIDRQKIIEEISSQITDDSIKDKLQKLI